MTINKLILCGFITKPKLLNPIVMFPSIGNCFFGRCPMFAGIPTASLTARSEPKAIKRASLSSKDKEDEKFRLTLTCKKCDAKISKVIRKTSYYNGFVIVICDACKNKYLIADNLNCVTEANNKKNIKEIMTEKGDAVQKIMSISLKRVDKVDGVFKSNMLLKSAFVTCINAEEEVDLADFLP